MAYLDTPRTDAGNGTYLSNGPNIDLLSAEPSFLSPVKKQSDLLSQLRNNRGVSLKTPRSRAALGERRNVPAQAEFTPLLKSVTKRNTMKVGKENGMPNTPAFLKPGYKGQESPALQVPESSVVYGDESGSFAAADEATPLPPPASSSAQSTPVPVLPKRDGNGMLTEQGNMMTLREQENIIDKIEKDNFGLKLKIHYLEESLRKSAPDYHQAALKENTELKVDKVTMQRELAKTRKLLNQAEHDLERYRQGLQDAEERKKRSHEEKAVQEERDSLRQRCKEQQAEIDNLRRRLVGNEEKDSMIEMLKNDIEDLSAELREKDREMEAREDEFDEKADQARDRIAELEEKLGKADEQGEEVADLREIIEDLQQEVERAKTTMETAKEECEEAQMEQRKAEDDLNELHDEMANKSFTTKGLSRQIEEKANKLEDDLHDVREKYANLQERLDEKSREVQRLQSSLQDTRQDAEVREQRLKDANELLRNEHDIIIRREKSSTTQVQTITKELQRRTEEKDLLQSRHDALTTESQSLQRELSKSQAHLHELQQTLEDEKRHSLDNDRALRAEAKDEIQKLAEEVDDLRRQLDDERGSSAANEEHWKSEKRDLNMQREKAQQKADGLQRTVNKLQESEGTLSGREMKLQEALESEKQRHQGEEALLSRQIRELRKDVDDKRRSLDENRAELLNLKEDLRVSKRDHTVSEEKVQALEDEVDVLQIALDEETDRAREEVAAARREADNLRLQIHNMKQDLKRAEAAHADARAEIERFQGDLQAGHGSKEQLTSRVRDLEGQLLRLRTDKQVLQDKLAQSEVDMASLRATVASAEAESSELAALCRDLSTSRTKETESLQREASQKDNIRELKRQITSLERQIHNLEISKLEVDSPRSSIGGSARKTELIEVRRQLADTHQQLKNLRAKLKDTERESQRKVLASEQSARQQIEIIEQERDQLEHQVTKYELLQKEDRSKLATAEKTITRLRTRLETQAKDIDAIRAGINDDRTIAEERKDLHEMLKDAKLEAEDLQVQLAGRETLIQAASKREKDLRAQLTRIRQERTLQSQKASALSTELENLQLRYETKVDEMARQQQKWEDERKSIVSRVRFPNMSISSMHESAELKELEERMEKKEKRHQGELRGMAKQIQWLRAKCTRADGFRAALIHEKQYLSLQIEMYQSCNKLDLRILEQMGVHKPIKKAKKKPTLKVVGLMVVAQLRMQKMQREWAVQKKLQASLIKKAEQVRRTSRKSIER
ncbi:hypothetical protein MMC30_006746 [Trapelia coarctata]|nr:hypothetical protein [Trapelia coarctata]